MKPDRTLFWITTIFGILISLIVIYALVMSLIWEVEEGSGHVLKDLANNILWFDLKNSTFLYLIYLVGYAIAWRKPLWGSTIILTISILGYIFGYKDERSAYVATFLVGFFYLAYWLDGRKKKNGGLKEIN